jgi:predicted house-cleaning noncanonical NTP pyrophosphatase (MazG superfamily)
MRKEYDKLVRDRIPEIIRQDGRQCGVEVMPEGEYVQALKDKLVEEAQEAAAAEPEDLVKEPADLYEVVDALMAACGIDREIVVTEQEERRQSRGGFNRRFRLLWTD